MNKYSKFNCNDSFLLEKDNKVNSNQIWPFCSMDEIVKKACGGSYRWSYIGDYFGDDLNNKDRINPLNWFKKK